MSRRRIVRFLAVVSLFALLGSCGLPTDSEPRTIPITELPSELGPDVRPTTAPDIPAFAVFFIGADGLLTPVARNVELSPDPSTRARATLQELILGTNPEEVRNGVTSAISTDTEIVSVLLGDDGVLFVDLAEGSLTSSSRENRRLAFAQIVWTMTELAFVDKVIFLLADRLVPVPIDDGLSNPGAAIDRSQFPSLDPRPSITFPDDEGVSDDDVGPVLPTPIPAVPDGLLSEGAGGSAVNQVELIAWMIDDEGFLTPRTRRTERDPGALLSALLDGPVASEPDIGVRSALLPTASVLNIDDLDVDEGTGTAFVDLSPDSLPPYGGDNERLRSVAQIVYTLTELAEIEFVSITILGGREPLPTQAGIGEAGDLLTRNDFASLISKQVFGVATPTPGVDPVPEPEPSDPNATPTADEPTVTATATATPTATPTTTPTPQFTPTPTPTPFELQVAPTAPPGP